jgi:thiamine-monophosphate kinase
MRISDIGEFGLIELVQQWTRAAQTDCDSPSDNGYLLTLDNGDDAAATTFTASPVTEFYTTDTMVDGIHFTAQTTPWRDLGWKALASNISDVAAMGGKPTWVLVTLGLPGDTLVDDIGELYAGMNEICSDYGTRVIGGDMVSSPVAFITVALTGISTGDMMVRSAAAPGHQVAVSGPVGGSAGGLKLLLESGKSDAVWHDSLIALHRRPRPHVDQGRALVDAGVRVAMDVSDGLADDLSKLCKASGVSARIMMDHVPVLEDLRQAFPNHWRDLALHGGEDYVLLFTAPPHVMSAAANRVPSCTIIGEIVAGATGMVTIIDAQGNSIPSTHAGWDHYASTRPGAS